MSHRSPRNIFRFPIQTTPSKVAAFLPVLLDFNIRGRIKPRRMDDLSENSYHSFYLGCELGNHGEGRAR